MSERVPQKTTVSIAGKADINGQVFGDRYAGSFSVRWPTISDRLSINIRSTARNNAHGPLDPKQLPDGWDLVGYIFAFMAVCGEDIPDWFDQEKLGAEPEFFDQDSRAIIAVWKEVQLWLESFSVSGRSS